MKAREAGEGRKQWLRFVTGSLAGLLTLLLPTAVPLAENRSAEVPGYIRQGLSAYAVQGTDAAVQAWLQGSPWENATTLLSRVAYLKQIETLHGRYQGWTLVETRQTRTSQWTYLRLDFERLPVYLGFTSLQYQGGWALHSLAVDTRQRYGVLTPPRSP